MNGCTRFVITIEESRLHLEGMIWEMAGTLVTVPMLQVVRHEIHTASINIAVCTAIQLISETHQRNISDTIVLDLIATELDRAFTNIRSFDRDTLMNWAGHLQHQGQMFAMALIAQVIPELGDSRFDADHSIEGYSANPCINPFITIDFKRHNGL